MEIELSRAERLRGEVTPPPDKSISHRAVLFSSVAKGRSAVRNFLRSEDTLSTLNAMRALGVEAEDRGEEILIDGRGLHGLKEPFRPLDCGNSGTTMRLLAGLLSGNPFFCVLAGDDSLSARPMERVIAPLSLMGARILARESGKYPPLAISGGGLKPIRYEMPVASAQVKSAVLLAGLYAEGETTVVEPVRSRDHTERMLPAFGARCRAEGLAVTVEGGAELRGLDIEVPGDFSAAAFLISAALMVDDSELLVKNVGINPTRTGFLEVLFEMGAKIEVLNRREVSGEPVADILCRASELSAVEVGRGKVPSMIDEFPVFCVLASRARGITRIRGAEELRVKETDRIKAMAKGLRAMGAKVEEYEDGLDVEGPVGLRGAAVDSRGDHRVAMSFSVAALAAEGKTRILDAGAVGVSFPRFYDTLKEVAA